MKSMSFRTYTMAIVGLGLLIAVMVLSLQPASMAEAASADTEGVEISKVSSSSVRGTCHSFSGQHTIYVCVPSKTPKGSPMTRLYEDGSARYKNGSTYDGDDLVFKYNGVAV